MACAQGVPHYFKENAAQGNHKAREHMRAFAAPALQPARTCADGIAPARAQVSAQKFSLLKEFVGVGCSARARLTLAWLLCRSL